VVESHSQRRRRCTCIKKALTDEHNRLAKSTIDDHDRQYVQRVESTYLNRCEEGNVELDRTSFNSENGLGGCDITCHCVREVRIRREVISHPLERLIIYAGKPCPPK
jgi:hypothetical protein